MLPEQESTPLPLGAVDPATTLCPLAFLPGDPTVKLGQGRFLRATATPAGPGLIDVRWPRRGEPDSQRRAWVRASGPGGTWLLQRAPRLLGLTDSVDGFDPEVDPVRTLWRRHRGLRLTRTGTLWHDLACFIVQQRIVGRDAADQWRRLVLALGSDIQSSAAPGLDSARLVAPPGPAVVARLTYADLHPFGMERARAATLIRAAREVARVESRVDGAAGEALPALGLVPGIGPWTLSSLAALTWADADTVVVGDYGLPGMVSYALTGVPKADDVRMIELLAPFRPHRLRVMRLLALAPAAPRRHPRARRMDIRSR